MALPTWWPRLWARITIDPIRKCWLLDQTGAHGYGTFRLDGRHHRAHRLTYQIFRGPIPNGWEIDHLCRRRSCCNPNHLEAVTHLENLERAVFVQTFCRRRLHRLEGDSVHTFSDGRRICRACRQAARLAHYEANRGRISRRNAFNTTRRRLIGQIGREAVLFFEELELYR